MDRSLSSTIPRVFGLLLTASALWASPALAQSPLDPTQPAPVDPITASAATNTTLATTTTTTASSTVQRPRGVAVSLNLNARYNVVSPDAGTGNAGTASIGGGILVGYKLDRLVVGAAFDIGHTDSITTYVSGSSTSTGSRSDTSFQLGPAAQFAILRSQDSRIELIGSAQITFGRTFTTTTQSPGIPVSYSPDVNATNFRLAYQLAPGLRYWAHPQFAVTVLTGLSGDDTFYGQNEPSGLRGDVVNTVSLFGSIGALGVF